MENSKDIRELIKQAIINQLTSNRQALENKITKMGIFKVKMLLVKRFSGKKAKLKGFLI